MSVYKLQKKSRSGRRVAVRAERIEWNLPAMIICLLLAFAIWLYVVSFSNHSSENIHEETTPAPDVTEPVDGEESVRADADCSLEEARV